MSACTFTDSEVKTETKLEISSQYQVIFHNDDVTTIQFVVLALCDIFHKTQEQANEIANYIHTHGAGCAGLYDEEIAFTKQEETLRLAAQQGQHEFVVTVEEL